MKRIILARFKSACFETGKAIRAGDRVLYDPSIKKVYCETSDEFRAYNNRQSEENIPDPGEQYFDNWCQHNNI